LHLNQVLFVFALNVFKFELGVHVDLGNDFYVFLSYLLDLSLFLGNTAVDYFNLFPVVFPLLFYFQLVVQL